MTASTDMKVPNDLKVPPDAVGQPAAADRADRGAATVATLTLCFAFFVGALVWLSSTVDRSLHDRADAAEVALQAARAGAQTLDPRAVRRGVAAGNTAAARSAAHATAAQLLAANGETGSVSAVTVNGNRVTVTVTITTGGRSVSATASATPRPGRSQPGR